MENIQLQDLRGLGSSTGHTLEDLPVVNSKDNIIGMQSVRAHTSEHDDSSQEEEPEYPEGGFRAYLVLLGSFLGLTANFGLVNSSGAIQTYLATHQLSESSASTIAWIFSIYLALAFGGTIFVGPYFDTRGSLSPMVGGTLLVFVGLMAAANSTKVWHFILSLSLCVGVGNAMCISPLVGVISHWFHRQIGFAIGLSSMGGSVGGMVIPIMLRSLYQKVGYAWAIRSLAFMCLGLSLISTFLIKERFTKSVSNDDYDSKRHKFVGVSKKLFNLNSLTDSKFIFLVLGVLLGEMGILCATTYYGTYAIAQGVSESESYILFTLYSAAGVLGRLCLSFISDRLGHFNVMLIMILSTSLSMLAVWLPFGSHHAILYVFIILLGFFSASIFSTTPACLRQITPVRDFGSKYGLMYFLVSCGNLVGIPLGSAIISDSSKFHYNMFALFCGLVSFASSFFWIFSRYKSVGFRLNVKI
ncbi:MFS general substrate transporter [Yamadazyma tenuis ATCC 10573]|uniref:MFS general substrate transporter n=1 Tax=Candida tenuis (strain ATCC 10573 / BCRC 21748 / CBS 615 / JCM 9827 / NBRC 10315 / NRRL Y-1498 / VKM Y-70) TaxID=590646 RepID=G3AX22_CANTC|nr:MFS general substrate transporter [Yamadazyma tenuis ATCC 10573]EGV66669.1 MFS general substrate transporter [Yamadazyma tenuis ATCC 10573]